MAKVLEVTVTRVDIVAVEVDDALEDELAMDAAMDAAAYALSFSNDLTTQVTAGPFDDGSEEADRLRQHADKTVAAANSQASEEH